MQCKTCNGRARRARHELTGRAAARDATSEVLARSELGNGALWPSARKHGARRSVAGFVARRLAAAGQVFG